MTIPMIGADPEVFLWDTANKHFVSAATFFPGTKKEPYKVEKGAVQVDGVALEFNIQPASNEDEFLDHICSVHTTIQKMVREVNPNWEIRHTPYATFTRELWDTVPEEAKELGCDPDYNSDSGQVNQNPTVRINQAATQLKLGAIRTASGHIHIGFTDKDEDLTDAMHLEDCRFVANYFYKKNFAHPRTTEEWSRVSFYGNHGAYRPKKYGVELRSPSNTWLGPNGLVSEASVRKMYKDTIRLFQLMESGHA